MEAEGDVYSFRCPINDRISLYVSVELQGDSYRVLRWQASVDESMIDETQELWDGAFLPGM